MVGRQLKEARYRTLQADLLQHARNMPLCPAYETDIVLNGENYALFIQMERRYKVYALYALRSVYESDVNAVQHELITNNGILSALLELLIYQGVKGRVSAESKNAPSARLKL